MVFHNCYQTKILAKNPHLFNLICFGGKHRNKVVMFRLDYISLTKMTADATLYFDLVHAFSSLSHFSQCTTAGVTGHGMCYPVCWIVHIKEPLLLIGKNNSCASSGFHLLPFEWSLTICQIPMPYNRK